MYPTSHSALGKALDELSTLEERSLLSFQRPVPYRLTA
jgi:hypothetical protein